jgi:SAM-dependent methyltransferase
MFLMENERAIGTKQIDYTERLQNLQGVWWKRIVDVQMPWKIELARLNMGRTLDVGCGIGRNLLNLKGNGVGIDHNEHSVEVAKHRGLKAFLPDEFVKSEYAKPNQFDSMLLSHVAEHLIEKETISLLLTYLPYLTQEAKIVIVTPQESGFTSDPTHTEFVDFESSKRILLSIGFAATKCYSFPFPRFFGRFFKYNSFTVVGFRQSSLLAVND